MRYIQDGVQARAYCGVTGTGKTQKLVEECKALADAGEKPSDILVFAASRSAAATLEARLEGAGVAGVRVTTPVTWALEVLTSDAAREFTGREAHVLNAYEQDFFFEDMRVNGAKQHRLREMLKFFYRSWSEMREDEDGWLITVEEKEINRIAKADLHMLRAYHPCEVVAACVRYLMSDAAVLEGLRVKHVLADDWRAMSRASQRLSELLAGKNLAVTWDTVASLVGEEPYGYAEGLVELEVECSALERVNLDEFMGSACAYEAVANLFKQDCISVEVPSGTCAEDGAPHVRMVSMLDKEPASVVDAVREALEAGVKPDDIFVAAGRASWVGRVRGALECSGIAASWVEDTAYLPGDIRDSEKCADMAMANAVRLVADPRSCLAWRCWCGFGDYLCRSAAFSDLAHALEGTDEVKLCDLLLALIGEGELFVGGDMLDRERVEQRVREGKAMLEEVKGLTGAGLVDVIRKHVCTQGQETPEFDALIGEVAAGECACDLLARIDAAFTSQAPAEGCVRVGVLDSLIGQTPRVLIVCGLTNGLYPEKGYFDLLQKTIDDQAKMHERLIEQLVEVCGKAGERLVLSGFTHADILDAEPMKLMSERIRLRNGRRVCEFAPSAVVDYATGAKTTYER